MERVFFVKFTVVGIKYCNHKNPVKALADERYYFNIVPMRHPHDENALAVFLMPEDQEFDYYQSVDEMLESEWLLGYVTRTDQVLFYLLRTHPNATADHLKIVDIIKEPDKSNVVTSVTLGFDLVING